MDLERVRHRQQPVTEENLECLELKLRDQDGVSTMCAPRGDELFALWSILDMVSQSEMPVNGANYQETVE